MGKNKFILSVLTGAIIGGLVSLVDPTTRGFAKEKLDDTSNQAKDFFQNPSGKLRSAKTTFNQFNDRFQNGADNAIDALEQVENTLDKLSKNR